ncbi:MAG: ATP-binding protein [Candidatus Zixiibacteriota bacterium]|nr:MAG: ATP-binding protein [candidate division Zixibacteria bacterium]
MEKPIITENSISIPSSQEYLVDVDSFVEMKLSAFGVEKSTIADIAISVTEIVINGIVHGNKSMLEKLVTIEIGKQDSAVEIVITDQGTGFDPDSIESPIDEENLMKEVGRGVFITRSLMDSVEIDSSPGEGTRVTLRKQI